MPLDRKAKEALTYLATHLVYGLAAGAAFGIGTLAIDLGHLRTLALSSSHPILVLVLFFFGLFVTFGSVGMGVGIMNMAKDDESDPD
ncbi:hypothetical protein [Magnetospirillum moscoviense]|uniref:Uncharacterized protein n=1 Tax=Magnetospirillum moscoviense TaxID=1437059 RepID=A0A178M662_9PROT|nr:hypothetical protein [Magnetospirillum moscoviense]OAN43717.1 hypothetical protein A6A05_05065 [Magnetospirillum moscoviense]